MFNSFCQQVSIVFTEDDIFTLHNVVIIDLTQKDLFPQSCATQEFVSFDVVQVKKRTIIIDPINQFFPLAIEILDVYTNRFMCFTRLCQCHLELDRAKRPSFFYLGYFYYQKISITLQKD